MKVTRTDAPVGAYVEGIDLASTNRAEIAELEALIQRHSVLVFPRQALTPQQQLDFTAQYGTIRRLRQDPMYSPSGYPDILRISNIVEDGRPIGAIDAGQFWHSDNCIVPCPPFRSTLYAIELPSPPADGTTLGDTLFVGTAEAYETLPEDVKRAVEGRKATHAHAKRNHTLMQRQYGDDFQGRSIDHPIVRTHPVTKKKCLYVNEGYTTRVLGMPESESDELLQYLFRHITREEGIFRHRWNIGDLVFWDDCALQHKAVADYPQEARRLLYRTTTDGAQVE